MRTQQLPDRECRATFADEVVFAYNPLFLYLEDLGENIDKLLIKFSDDKGVAKSINVNVFNGKTKVYYSRILQLFFDNVKCQRAKKITVVVCDRNTPSYILASFSHIVLWGSLAKGERFDAYGTFRYNKARPYFERTRVWFKNFPFMVTMFNDGERLARRLTTTRYDDVPYSNKNNIFTHDVWQLIDTLNGSSFDKDIQEVLPADKHTYAVIYVRDENRFYGVYDFTHLCKTWPAAGYNGYLDNSYYNTDANKPRTDMLWYDEINKTYWRYSNEKGTLVPLGCYYGGEKNLFDVCPEICLPQAQRNIVIKQTPEKESELSSVFDKSFDFTFKSISEFTTITNIIISDKKAGYYLRWIDRFGCYQFFLFTKGDTTIKNKLSGNTWEDLSDSDNYPNQTRDIHITATETCKCQAHTLPDEIFAYVNTIVTSPLIDLYKGKTKDGEEIWVPVTIVAASHKYNPRDVCHNIEISFTMPDIEAQSL